MKRNNFEADKTISIDEKKKVHDFLLSYIRAGYFNKSKYDKLANLIENQNNNENNSFDSLILQAMLARSNPERAFEDFKKSIEKPSLLTKVLDLSKPLLSLTYDFLDKNDLFKIENIDKNNLLNTENIILIIGDNTSRYITVLGGIPFYKSSGKNSKEADTWFPFCGFQENELIAKVDKINIGYLIKPNLDRLTKITDYFPIGLSSYYETKKFLKNIFFRTGNFAGMCFSMLIGGGFWTKEEGIILKNFILTHYQDQINQFYEKYKNAIENIRTFNDHPKDDIEQKKGNNTQDYQEINTWLKNHGSLAVKSDTWSMNLDFQYNDLNIKNDIIITNKM